MCIYYDNSSEAGKTIVYSNFASCSVFDMQHGLCNVSIFLFLPSVENWRKRVTWSSQSGKKFTSRTDIKMFLCRIQCFLLRFILLSLFSSFYLTAFFGCEVHLVLTWLSLLFHISNHMYFSANLGVPNSCCVRVCSEDDFLALWAITLATWITEANVD